MKKKKKGDAVSLVKEKNRGDVQFSKGTAWLNLRQKKRGAGQSCGVSVRGEGGRREAAESPVRPRDKGRELIRDSSRRMGGKKEKKQFSARSLNNRRGRK